MENKIAIIKNGVVDNIIIATKEFGNTLPYTTIDVTSTDCGIGWSYNGTSFTKPLETPERAKIWRDSELKGSDFIVPLIDYPNYAAWITYRQELRDWPSTDAFPDTKPTI